MKPEHIIRVQKQESIMWTEMAKLNVISIEQPERPPTPEDLPLAKRFDIMYEKSVRWLDGIANRRAGELHGYTPILRIPYEFEGEVIPLNLQFEVHEDKFRQGRCIEAHWFTYSYTGVLPLRQQEELSDKQVKEAASRSTYPYHERVIREFDNFEWSIVTYQEAIANLSAEELAEKDFTPEFIEATVALKV